MQAWSGGVVCTEGQTCCCGSGSSVEVWSSEEGQLGVPLQLTPKQLDEVPSVCRTPVLGGDVPPQSVLGDSHGHIFQSVGQFFRLEPATEGRCIKILKTRRTDT